MLKAAFKNKIKYLSSSAWRPGHGYLICFVFYQSCGCTALSITGNITLNLAVIYFSKPVE